MTMVMSNLCDEILAYDEDEILICPACDSEQPKSLCLLGKLGSIEHHRCRYCGMQWSEKPQSNE